MQNYLTKNASNQEEYNKDITLYKVKQATKTLKSHKHKGPDEVKNEFLKYGGEVLTETLQTFLK